jgi:hypothetical protein
MNPENPENFSGLCPGLFGRNPLSGNMLSYFSGFMRSPTCARACAPGRARTNFDYEVGKPGQAQL